MLSQTIARNCRPVSQLFQFLSVFGIDRFTVIEIHGSVIAARIGWPFDGTPGYDASEEIQDVSWAIDDDPLLDDALFLFQALAMYEQISIDKITASETEARALVSALGLPRDTLEKLLSIKVNMLDDGKETDAFFVHF
ncbi:hypothetical protein [Tateyamaria sp. SN6-1]|uniref:hypothetical protein n=1 Tax=Tateyamaria sp. SN6-1 TaxID=3092148 RepID=UPI0039F5258F